MKRYDVILADPPWPYRDRGQSGSGRPSGSASHYDTLTMEQIKGLNVAQVAADDALLFLWVTSPHLEEGLRTLAAWGFEYRTMAFTWVKTGSVDRSMKRVRAALREDGLGRTDIARIAGKLEGILLPTFPIGQGSYTRANPEFCLLGRRGKGLKRVDAGVRSEVLSPRRRHSEKPEIVSKRIERLVGPEAKLLEMFARRRRPGWDAWGNEIDNDCAALVVPGATDGR